jgi:hypothetical protein
MTRDASADTPHAGLNFFIAADLDGDTTNDCDTTDSTGIGSACQFDTVGAPFDLKFYLESAGGLEYAGYDSLFKYSGVCVVASCDPVAEDGTYDTDPWPECTFGVANDNNDGILAIACAAFQPPTSTYTGLMAVADMFCSASGSITMNHGSGNTALLDQGLTAHAEGTGTQETLTITCGTVPVDTPTPTVPAETATPTLSPTPCPPEGCPTDTPTNTPLPATETPTRTATRTFTPTPTKECGDVDDDGSVNAIDALLILQVTAGLLDESDLDNAPSGDANGDGELTSVDAALVLQVEAGLLDGLDC